MLERAKLTRDADEGQCSRYTDDCIMRRVLEPSPSSLVMRIRVNAPATPALASCTMFSNLRQVSRQGHHVQGG